MENLSRHTKKVLIGIVGGIVVLAGLVMVPYPGPGWLVVFAGLAILATEFAFASRVLKFARGKYDQWVAWIKRQNIFVRVLVLAATGIVVIATLWLFNAFGIVIGIFNLDIEWLVSPLFR